MAELYAPDHSSAARAAHPSGQLAVCLAAMTGWALRAADGLITTGTINLAIVDPKADAHCDLQLANWLRERDRHSGPITAISLVDLPPFLATAMHPARAFTLQAWAAQHGIPCDLVTYAELLTDGTEVDATAVTAQALRASASSPACHSEALAIVALERLITTRERTA